MECARCRAVIADKAIVCYRCGAPTATGTATSPRPSKGAIPAWLAPLLVVEVLVLAGAASLSAPGSALQIGLLLAALSSAVLAIWLHWRRQG